MEDTQKQIDEILSKLGKDLHWLVEHLRHYLTQQDKRKESLRKYYQSNKDKLKEYHKQYRATHPQYREKAKERSRRARGR